MPVNFFNIGIDYKIKSRAPLKKWINSSIKSFQKSPGTINIILVTDDYLQALNLKHLNRNYYTDIISFNFNEGDIVSGDLYISYDRVCENAGIFSVSNSEELLRIIIHGILHLIGFDDHTKTDRENMTRFENKYLQLVKGLIII